MHVKKTMFCLNAQHAIKVKKFYLPVLKLKVSLLLYIYKAQHTTVRTIAYYLVG